MSLRNNLILSGTILTGIGLLASYTVSMSYEELKEWQELEVVVDNVGGLKELDEVQINGSRQGRVLRIQLYKSRQKMTLQVEPGLQLYATPPDRPELEGHAIELVPKNALGTMVVRITLGDPQGDPADMTQIFEGALREGLGTGEATPGRREAIRGSFEELARQTSELRNPEAGFAGAVLFDNQRARDVQTSLSELDDSWAKVDAALAQVEAEQGIGRFLLSTDTLVAVGDTIEAARDVLTRTRAGLRSANEGDAASGGWLGDAARATEVREALALQATTMARVRQGEGLLGRALDPSLANELEDQLAPLQASAAEGVEERGLLGLLSGEEAGEWTRQTAANLPRALERIRNQLADNPESADALRDGAANVEDALVNFERGMTYVKRGIMPARTNFANAMFAVF